MISIDKIRFYFLYMFVFSFGFEYWDPWGIREDFTVARLLGLTYAVLSLFNYKKSFSLAYNGQLVKLLFIVWFWIVTISVLHGPLFNVLPPGARSPYLFSFLQAIILFWILSNDFYRHPEIKKWTFLFFIFGMTTVGLLVPLGIGVAVDGFMGGRLRYFGANPNQIGQLSSIAILMVLVLLVHNKMFFGKKGFLLLASLPFLVSLVGLSGSRGAFITLVLGVAVFFVFYKTTLMKKICLLLIGAIITIYISGTLLQQYETLERRLTMTIQEQDTGTRFDIWHKVINIYVDNPIVGAGTTGYYHEMVERNNYVYKDPHNLFLYILVTSGIIGFTLYMYFYYSIFRKVWRYYKVEHHAAGLILFTAITFILFKSGGILADKTTWLLMAFISSPLLSGGKGNSTNE
jgi:O-antigen ligase